MTLVDSIVSLGVLTVLAGVAVPFLTTAREGSQVVSAARYLSAQAMLARSRALKHGAAVGLRFEGEADRYRFAAYVDGDGDGIRRADVVSGVDRPLGPFQRVHEVYPLVRFALDASVPPVTATSPAGANTDPVRFGRGDTLTFSPLGSATSGSLYLRGRCSGSPMRTPCARDDRPDPSVVLRPSHRRMERAIARQFLSDAQT